MVPPEGSHNLSCFSRGSLLVNYNSLWQKSYALGSVVLTRASHDSYVYHCTSLSALRPYQGRGQTPAARAPGSGQAVEKLGN